MRVVALFVVLAACTEFRARTGFAAYDVAAIACDFGATQWVSNGGRWDGYTPGADRSTVSRSRWSEQNPLLGERPNITALSAAASLGASFTVLLAFAPKIPAWLRWSVLAGIAEMETFIVINARQNGARMCGL